jgi:hypothetical protein
LISLGDAEGANHNLPETLKAYNQAQDGFHKQDTESYHEPRVIIKKIIETESLLNVEESSISKEENR